MALLKGFIKSSSDPEARELRELMLDDLELQNDKPPTEEDLKYVVIIFWQYNVKLKGYLQLNFNHFVTSS